MDKRWARLSLLALMAPLALLVSGARAEVRLGLQTQVEYNDNLFLDETDETEDILYRVAPWIALSRQWPRLLAELRYQPKFTWYEKNPEYDLTGHNVGLNFSGNPTRTFSLDLANQFIRGEEQNLERFTSQQSTRLPYSSYASTLTGTLMTGRDESVGFRLAAETLDYDKDSLSQDSTEIGGRVNGRQRLGDRDFVTLDAGYAEGEYDDSTSYALANGIVGTEHVLHARKRLFFRFGLSQTTGDARVNYTTWNPLVGVVGELKNVQYDVGAGFLIYDQEDADPKYYPSLVANVSVVKSWRRGEMTVSFASGYEEDFIESESPGFDMFASTLISGRYGLSPDWTCNASGELRGDSYQDTRPGGEDRNDVTLKLATGLEYQLMRRAALRLDYSFHIRRSEIDTVEYKENSVVLTMNIVTP